MVKILVPQHVYFVLGNQKFFEKISQKVSQIALLKRYISKGKKQIFIDKKRIL